MLFYIVLTAHIILCITLIGLVLIQQGKGADLGAAFGSGGSNTFFGAAGATAFITKLTTGIAVAFMVTSIVLINLYSSVARNGVPGGADIIQSKLQANKTSAPATESAASEAPAAPAEAKAPEAPAAAPAPATAK